jgi:dihydrofolate reductase
MQAQEQDTPQGSMPQLAIIVAMTRDRVIGSGGSLPWRLPGELKLFKRITMDGTVIMGRKTHASIGRPLPGRHNIVLSRTKRDLPGVQVCATFLAGLVAAAQFGRLIFIIGGAGLYRQALPLAEELHISWVEEDYEGDVYFPSFAHTSWVCCEEEDFPGFHYARYRRKERG